MKSIVHIWLTLRNQQRWSYKMKTKEEIKTLMDQIFRELQVTREAGQKEYAHDDNNAFANFERLSTDLNIDRKQVLWVYVYKHIDGIKSFLKGHRSQREDIRGRIKDVIVYLILLWGMIDDDDSKPSLADEEYTRRYHQEVVNKR